MSTIQQILSSYGSTPAPTDPNWSSVVALLHMDGADGGTTFTDQKSHAVTPSYATTGTSVKKFGTAATIIGANAAAMLSLAASNDWGLGTGDWTVEFWCYPTGTDACHLAGQWVSPSYGSFVAGQWALDYSVAGAGKLSVTQCSYAYDTGTTISCANALPLNQWNFVSISRNGNTLRIAVNGTVDGSGTVTGLSFGVTSQPFKIGSSGNQYNQFKTNIDDFRITKGVGRYSGNYSVPTAEFPNS